MKGGFGGILPQYVWLPLLRYATETIGGSKVVIMCIQRCRLCSHEHDGGKHHSQRENERETSNPRRPQNQPVLESSSALSGNLYDPQDARSKDEIVDEGQRQEDCHKAQLGGQDLRPPRWVRNRNPSLMQ